MAPRPPSGRRRAVRTRGGPIEVAGDATWTEGLQAAWESTAGADDQRLTHGFHSYPARMHPAVAATVLQRFAQRGTRILDPFCGSGTVLVEAMVAGLPVTGSDLNPLAIRVAQVRCAVRSPAQRERFAAQLSATCEVSREYVKSRSGPHVDLPPSERQWYAPHTLRELAGLWDAVQSTPAGFDRQALEVVVSSILIKVSRQKADTAAGPTDPTPRGRGAVTRLFEDKGRELIDRWSTLFEAVPAGTRPPRLVTADVRTLPERIRTRFDLVVTSPPYGGTYDYAEHHARRLAWLKLDGAPLRKQEIGSRRQLSTAKRGGRRSPERQWDRQVADMLVALHAMLRPDGAAVIVIGDGQVGGARMPADEQLRRLGPPAGFSVVATVSQHRPDFAGGPPRREHLIALTPV